MKGYEVPGEYTHDVIESLRKNFKKSRLALGSSVNGSAKSGANGSGRGGVARSMSRSNTTL